MKGKGSAVLMAAGICLGLVGLVLAGVFYLRAQQGQAHSRQIAAQLENILPERSDGVAGLYPEAGMPVLQLDGADYVALVEVPGFGVTLPVADQWDSSRLDSCPARFCGSAYTPGLVIGGSQQQFIFCGQVDIGAEVTVTDMTGAEFTYTVARVDRSDHASAQWLTGDGWDLTLFCHDVYAMQYIAVRCTKRP